MASMPRLVAGQGAIIAVGTMDYPAEYRGARRDASRSGISKVMSRDLHLRSPHHSRCGIRHVPGQTAGAAGWRRQFLRRDFRASALPYNPVRWEPDRQVSLPGATGHTAEVAKEAAVLQLINAYRVRGHLIADLDPLGGEPGYHPELDPLRYGLTIWDLDREFLTGSLGEAIGEGAPKRLPPCARFSRRCARPTAARSDAST